MLMRSSNGAWSVESVLQLSILYEGSTPLKESHSKYLKLRVYNFLGSMGSLISRIFQKDISTIAMLKNLLKFSG